jgi:hypothetical protein
VPEGSIAVFSGGTEGVLSPHVTMLVKEKSATGLVAAAGRTRVLEPDEVGTRTQMEQVSLTVKRMMGRLVWKVWKRSEELIMALPAAQTKPTSPLPT